jgi:two-component system, LytTR family, response regulator
MHLKAVIVEDEPIARELLASMLEETADVEVVGEADDVLGAVALLRETKPDVVFLDIRMADGTGFDVIEAIGLDSMPPFAFVTAYDEYAVRAFDVRAVDYVLKPFDEERLKETLNRIAGRLESGTAAPRPDIVGLMRELSALQTTPWISRLAVDAPTHLTMISTSEITWIEAKDKYVLVHTPKQTYSLREGISTLAARLDPSEFLRVHRSALVRLDHVREIHRWTRGDYQLVLVDGTKLITGKTYKKEVEERLLGNRRPPAG